MRLGASAKGGEHMASTRQRTAEKARSRRVSNPAASTVRIKRAYEEPDASDGYRVLVDRLWPRGVQKDALSLDAWMKDIGPSDALRRWFGHDPARWDDFVTRYHDELRREPAAGLVAELAARASHGPITLVYGAKDELHNQAVVLRDVIARRARRPRAPVSARKIASTTRRTGKRARPTHRAGTRPRPS
ncbi:Putative uroporphyrin-III c-methyltransferase [Minicystis rosea]|nr:Putative uroporphyrin-III c-methyltransferase [Minicystis rosea]